MQFTSHQSSNFDNHCWMVIWVVIMTIRSHDCYINKDLVLWHTFLLLVSCSLILLFGLLLIFFNLFIFFNKKGWGHKKNPTPPSTRHVKSPNSLMSMTLILSIYRSLLSHQIWTQMSIYRIFWNDAWDCFPPPSNRCELIDFLMEEGCCVPPAEFQTLVDSIPRCIQATHGAWWPNT